MPVETISWKKEKVRYIDQTRLPREVRFVECASVERLWRAIKALEIRGAPAIGIAGALGILLGIKKANSRTGRALARDVQGVARYLAASRPTAVNLFWALDRMVRLAKANASRPPDETREILTNEALAIIEEDKRACRAMARHGARLVRSADTILTHCNAGGLATADYGTALGVIFEAHKEGKRIKVYVDETRPLLQGARLTAWELMHEGVDTTLICDNMAASLMAKGKIDKIFVGADRIARNGDAANKIGTYGLAVLARHHHVPFYVVAPLSTFDFRLETGADIPIEERDASEVRTILGKPIAPARVKVYNPAFDVTPNKLINAIVTERGVFRPPLSKSIRRVFESKN